MTLEGLTFSDELGGVEIMQGWGTGTLDDPFVLVEEITAHEPAILMVRGMTHAFGNRIRSHHDVGFALTKIVRNRTEQAWSQFDLELREFIDHPSPFGDGLSFGQASEVGRPFSADRFGDMIETREPYDGISFFDGAVEPGETVVISVVITDTTPRYDFFLFQKRDSPLAHAPVSPGDPGPFPLPTKHRYAMLLLRWAFSAGARFRRSRATDGLLWTRGGAAAAMAARATERGNVMMHRCTRIISRAEEVKGSSERGFGLTVGGILLLIAAVRVWLHDGYGAIEPVLGAVGLALVVLGLVAPGSLAPLNRAWTKLGLLLFKVVNPIVLALIYLTTIVPIGLIMRAFWPRSAAPEARAAGVDLLGEARAARSGARDHDPSVLRSRRCPSSPSSGSSCAPARSTGCCRSS